MINPYKEKNTLELKESRKVAIAEMAVGKENLSMIDEVIEERFLKTMLHRYDALGKQHGVAKFKSPDGFTIKSDVKKTVKWDSKVLQAIASKLKWSEVEATFDIVFKISEKTYKELPDELMAQVDTARSVVYADPKIIIED